MKLVGLEKSFGGKPVITGLSCQFAPLTCIMGPSGCGKTTLLNLILGTIKPDSGQILDRPKSFSVLFQEDRLCAEFSAPENLCMLRGVTRAQAEEVLRRAGIEDMESPVSHFSGGMGRRVALARALVYPGQLLMLDEPFKGLDSETRKTAADLINRYRGGRNILMVSHDEAEAALLSCEILGLQG